MVPDTPTQLVEGIMMLETLCFAVVALALAAPGLVVVLMSDHSKFAPSDVSPRLTSEHS
jgi:hypothetical protein